ncbi:MULTISPECIES: LysM peptidoglycan-binding domain-containing protein [Actinomycetaceae]|uniref:LysM peptidoglycan-binding domain-containing protein n=1 Tax=Actinomycetaceae TaxID=2049 RepID=UPI0003979DCE|nr:LysM peptidoglycan-binding domain-containing protein [Actinobaculum sp. oral taxon 183]ERH15053.1 LysM domain protein [Actinobaculum sp. oral taxon 183 str. F0552]
MRGACERGGRSRTRAVPAAIRWACAALVAVALAVAGLVVGTLMGPSPSADPAAHPRVVVQSGDTLWSIAEGVEGAPDTATAVADIAALNGLPSHAVAPGQVLELPRY